MWLLLQIWRKMSDISSVVRLHPIINSRKMIAQLTVNATQSKSPPLQIRSLIFEKLALICLCLWLSSLLPESFLQMWPAGIKGSFPPSCLSEENKESALVHISPWWAHQAPHYTVCLFTTSCTCEVTRLRWQLWQLECVFKMKSVWSALGSGFQTS